MPTREELIQQVKRKRLIEQVKQQRAAGANVAAAPDDSMPGAMQNIKETALDTVVGLAEPGRQMGSKINAGIRAGAQEVGDLFRDKENTQDFSKRYSDYYNQNISQDQPIYDEAVKRSPTAVPLGEMATEMSLGATLPMSQAKGVIGAGTRIAQAGLGNYLQTGLTSKDESPFNDRSQQAGLQSTAIQSGLEALPVVGKYAGKALAKPSKYLMSMLGPSVKNMDEYLANAPRINAAPDATELKGMIDQDVGTVGHQAERAEMGVDMAKNDARSTKQINESKMQMADQKANQSYERALYDLKNTKPPEKMAKDIAVNIEQMGKELSDQSTASFDAARGVTLPTAKFKSYLTSEIKNLEVNGAPPLPGTDAEKTYNKLVGMRDAFDQYGTQLGGQDLKKIVKNFLDPEIQWSMNAGERPEIYQKSIRGLRGNISEGLKEASPEYAGIMNELAPDTKLVKEMSEVFGDESKAIGAIKAASDPNNPRGRMYRELLAKYDARNGTKFMEDLDASLKAKSALNDPGQLEMMQILNPDAFDARRTARALGDESSGANKVTEWAQDAANQANAKKKNFSRLGPGSTQGAINSIGQGRNLESEAQLAQLGKESGRDYVQNAKDLNTRRSFEKDYTQGSKRALLGKTIGGALAGGYVNDQTNGEYGTGGAVGAIAGALGDRYGGKVVKAILDGALKSSQINQLMKAMQRGPTAVSLTHMLMMKGDEEYRKAVESQSK